MEQTVEEPLPCAQIARRAGLSMRRMQRLFEKALGTTPVRHYQFIRLTKAHALLQQTDLSVTEIAVSAGFGSLEHFCRIYRRQFGCRPRDDRRQSVDGAGPAAIAAVRSAWTTFERAYLTLLLPKVTLIPR